MTKVPRSADVGKLISMKGTIIRTGMVKMLETSKDEILFCSLIFFSPTPLFTSISPINPKTKTTAGKMYECSKCSHSFYVESEHEQFNNIPKPTKCLANKLAGISVANKNPGGGGAIKECDGTKFKLVATEAGESPHTCKDYQEIKVQEHVSKLAVGTIPRSINVILEDDIVDTCKAGDDVTISGIVFRRFKFLDVGTRCDVEIAMLANHVRVHNEQRTAALTEDLEQDFEAHWREYADRPLAGEGGRGYAWLRILIGQPIPNQPRASKRS